MRVIRPHLYVFLFAFISVISVSCDNDDDDLVQPTIVKEWSIPISTKFENPSPAARTETGTAQLQLMSDNTFQYHITINGLPAGDPITAGYLHTGDPVTNGGVILNLNPVFASGMASGTVDIPRQTLADSIETGAVYLNLHTAAFPAGLIRGQLDKTLDFAMDVPLSGAAEVPPVNTTATGLALLRLTSDKTLFYKITVSNVEAGDALTAAHIHPGAAGVNGGVLVGLIGSAAEFGTNKSIVLTDAVFNSVKNDPVYVNVHSVNRGSGLIRGQIR